MRGKEVGPSRVDDATVLHFDGFDGGDERGIRTSKEEEVCDGSADGDASEVSKEELGLELWSYCSRVDDTPEYNFLL